MRQATLRRETAAGVVRRNAARITIVQHVTTADAWVTLTSAVPHTLPIR